MISEVNHNQLVYFSAIKRSNQLAVPSFIKTSVLKIFYTNSVRIALSTHTPFYHPFTLKHKIYTFFFFVYYHLLPNIVNFSFSSCNINFCLVFVRLNCGPNIAMEGGKVTFIKGKCQMVLGNLAGDQGLT